VYTNAGDRLQRLSKLFERADTVTGCHGTIPFPRCRLSVLDLHPRHEYRRWAEIEEHPRFCDSQHGIKRSIACTLERQFDGRTAERNHGKPVFVSVPRPRCFTADSEHYPLDGLFREPIKDLNV
jgi:hypothetical protein